MTWRVEPDEHRIWLYPDNSDQPHMLDPGEAWDLGDDLIIAADSLLKWESVGYTTLPPWSGQMKVATVALPTKAHRLALVCDDHGIVEYEGMQISIGQILEGARTHWKWQHSADAEVAEDAEGEDEHGQGQPAQADAAGEVAGREDGQDRGDDVQDHGKHRPTPPPGGVMAW